MSQTSDQLIAELERLEELVSGNKTQVNVIRKAIDLVKVTAEMEGKPGAPEVVMHPMKPKTLPVDADVCKAIQKRAKARDASSRLRAQEGDARYMQALENENWDLCRGNKALWGFIQEQGRVIMGKAHVEEHRLQLDNAGVVALEALDKGLDLIGRLLGQQSISAGGYRDYVDVPELMQKAREALRKALDYRQKSGQIPDKGQNDGDPLRDSNRADEG